MALFFHGVQKSGWEGERTEGRGRGRRKEKKERDKGIEIEREQKDTEDGGGGMRQISYEDIERSTPNEIS